MEKLKYVYLQFHRERCLFFLAFIGNTLIGLILIDLLQKLIDTAIALDTGHFKELVLRFLVILGIYLVAIIADQYFLRRLIYYGEIALKRHTFVSFVNNHKMVMDQDLGEAVSAMNNDTAIISFWMSKGFISITGQFIILLLYLFLMARYNLVITGITFLIILAVFGLSRNFGKKESFFTGKQQKLYGKINAYLYNCLQNFPVVSQLHNGEYFCKRLKKLYERGERDAVRRLSRFQALNDAMLNFMTNTLPLLIFATGLLFVKTGQMTTGETIAIMLVAQKLNEPIILIADLILDKKNAEGVYERIAGVYTDMEPESRKREMESFDQMHSDIVSYQYPNAGKNALSSVIFEIKKGDMMLLKGESGSGKSTIIRLLCRLVDLHGLHGIIEYNGYPIGDYALKEYYMHILQVKQETVLVEGSIQENVLLGDCFTQSEIDEVLWTCVLDTFISERGIDFFIKENGSNISGGERQRIGIARMLLRKPEVLILDEVTSALDEETRQIFARRLMTFKQKYCMTILVISHMNDFDEYCNKTISI